MIVWSGNYYELTRSDDREGYDIFNKITSVTESKETLLPTAVNKIKAMDNALGVIIKECDESNPEDSDRC